MSPFMGQTDEQTNGQDAYVRTTKHFVMFHTDADFPALGRRR